MCIWCLCCHWSEKKASRCVVIIALLFDQSDPAVPFWRTEPFISLPSFCAHLLLPSALLLPLFLFPIDTISLILLPSNPPSSISYCPSLVLLLAGSLVISWSSILFDFHITLHTATFLHSAVPAPRTSTTVYTTIMHFSTLATAVIAAAPALVAAEGRLGWALGTKKADGSCKYTADYEADFKCHQGRNPDPPSSAATLQMTAIALSRYCRLLRTPALRLCWVSGTDNYHLRDASLYKGVEHRS